MKKIIMILSALLCLTMLFASCNPKNTNDPAESIPLAEITPTETDLETQPEPIPEELKTNYDAIITQWGEYISFEGEARSDINATLAKLYERITYQNDSPDHREEFNISRQGDLVLFSYHSTNNKTEFNSAEGYDEDVTIDTYRYNLFNIVSGEEIAQTQYTHRYYPSRKGAVRYKYASVQSVPSLSHLSYGIIEMEITSYELIRDANDASYDRWEVKTTYNYYDLDGKILVEGLENDDFEIISESSKYQTIIRIGDKYFLTKNGEIVAKLGDEMQVKLDFSADEYSGFQYDWAGNTIRVLDTSANRMTVDWCFGDYFNQRDGKLTVYTLGNGNLLFQKDCTAWEDEGFLLEGDSLSPIYVLVDVKSGEIREAYPTCTIDGVTYEYVIASLINNANNQNTGLSLKNGNHQLAEISLISEGIVSPKTTLAILDSELQVVATLDRFLQDQAGIYGVLENGDLLIYTDSNAYYTVDVNKNGSQRLLLFVDPDGIHQFVAGGFIKDGILYNDNLEPLVNMTRKYSAYSLSAEGLKAWSAEDRCYHYLSINSAGELVIRYAPETGTYLNSFSYDGCTVYKSVNPEAGDDSDVPYVYTVYNAQGQTIETLYGESCAIVNGMLMLTSGNTSTYYILK